MKKTIIILSIILSSFATNATIHVVKVWEGYLQFVSAVSFSQDITIQLGDTVQWLPLDAPSMVHTITSTNIPSGAASFDQIWQPPADTFFQYIPQVAGLYEYECTPHVAQGMVGSITVIGVPTSINGSGLSESDFSIYPNPATDFIRFNKSKVVHEYRIYSSNGNLVLSGTTDDRIIISTLADGIYYIMIVGDKPSMMKFVKQ